MTVCARAGYSALLMTGCLAFAGVSIGFAQTAPAPAPVDPTPTRVALPADFTKSFQLYGTVDRLDTKMVRFLYINKDALAKVKAGEPFPEGTVLVMENRDIALEAGGTPIKGKDGRLQPTARVKATLVMEKRAGWGETNLFPADKDNGNWEYAVFRPDGSLNPIKLDNCYACHLPQNKDGLDFTFSGAMIREAAKK